MREGLGLMCVEIAAAGMLQGEVAVCLVVYFGEAVGLTRSWIPGDQSQALLRELTVAAKNRQSLCYMAVLDFGQLVVGIRD